MNWCPYFDSLLGILLQGSSLALEDGHISFEQVLPLHPLLPGHGAHQDGCIQVLEGHLLLVSGDNLCGKRELITEVWHWMHGFSKFWLLRSVSIVSVV